MTGAVQHCVHAQSSSPGRAFTRVQPDAAPLSAAAAPPNERGGRELASLRQRHRVLIGHPDQRAFLIRSAAVALYHCLIGR
mmetsp:Transcript_18142/g.40609  ORF Transcript_18142/g.40609 Transcript_18142/m.40609 type:complete len:81 (-) Transcript_18142:68-310(-)